MLKVVSLKSQLTCAQCWWKPALVRLRFLAAILGDSAMGCILGCGDNLEKNSTRLVTQNGE
jgi:hypothetical protein